MEFVIVLMWALVWAFLCSTVAERNHRRAWLWAALGVLFNVFALAALAVLGDAYD